MSFSLAQRVGWGKKKSQLVADKNTRLGLQVNSSGTNEAVSLQCDPVCSFHPVSAAFQKRFIPQAGGTAIMDYAAFLCQLLKPLGNVFIVASGEYRIAFRIVALDTLAITYFIPPNYTLGFFLMLSL